LSEMAVLFWTQLARIIGLGGAPKGRVGRTAFCNSSLSYFISPFVKRPRIGLDPRFQHPRVHRLFEPLQLADSLWGVRKLLGDALIDRLGHENLSRTGSTL
jgi:hypothetical protein